jgi:hypothetical protein
VVDDDPVILTLVERSLRAEGFRVWTATRGRRAEVARGRWRGRWTSREHLLKHGVDVPEARLLKKPFVAAQLVSSIRQALSD